MINLIFLNLFVSSIIMNKRLGLIKFIANLCFFIDIFIISFLNIYIKSFSKFKYDQAQKLYFSLILYQ